MSAAVVQGLQTAGLAVGVSLATVVILATVAKPDQFDARKASVEASAEAAARSIGRRPPPALSPGAVCEDTATDAARLQGAILRVAQASQLADLEVSVTPLTSEPTAPRLRALTVTLEATGGYDSALMAVRDLTSIRPLLYLDSVDLASRTSSVSLSVSGRAFCSVQ